MRTGEKRRRKKRVFRRVHSLTDARQGGSNEITACTAARMLILRIVRNVRNDNESPSGRLLPDDPKSDAIAESSSTFVLIAARIDGDLFVIIDRVSECERERSKDRTGISAQV